MRLYHRTTGAGAAAILADGFRDGASPHPADQEWAGVWLADRPPAGGVGAASEALLVVELTLPAAALAAYEWAEGGKPRGEFLLPAELLNAHGMAWLAGAFDLGQAAGKAAGPY